MIRKPRVMKEMSVSVAKPAVKDLLDYMKEFILIQRRVSFKHPFPAVINIKKMIYDDAHFFMSMSFALSPKDANYRFSPAIEDTFAQCWKTVAKKIRADIKIRGEFVYVETGDFEVLKDCITTFVTLWQPYERSILKTLN